MRSINLRRILILSLLAVWVLLPTDTRAEKFRQAIGPYVVLEQGVDWNLANDRWTFVPMVPDTSLAFLFCNNNPTNAHAFTLTVSESRGSNPGLYVASQFTTTNINALAMNIGAGTCNQLVTANLTGAARASVLITGAAAAAGIPDTLSIFVVQFRIQLSQGSIPEGGLAAPTTGPNGFQIVGFDTASGRIKGYAVGADKEFPVAVQATGIDALPNTKLMSMRDATGLNTFYPAALMQAPYVFNGATWDRDYKCNSQAVIGIAGAGDTEIVPLTAGQTIKLCHVSLACSGANNISFIYGTGASCATGQTALTGVYPGVNTLALDFGPRSTLNTGVANAFCIKTSAAVTCGGVAIYAKY